MKINIPWDSKKLIDFFKKQPVKKVYLFGSYAKGEQKKESDIDFIVELDKGTDLFRFIKIKLQLEDLLQKTVDLISLNGISERLRSSIDIEKILIYEK